MNKIFKMFFTGFAAASLFAAFNACSPESFDGPNQGAIPSIAGIDFEINDDQTVNQATFRVANLPPATYALWTVNGNMYSTLNPMNWANNKAGTYDVELRLGNRNGFSQGSVRKSFTFNNSQVDLSPYYARIARTWRINYAEQGHMGCGEVGSDGSGWWTAEPNDKADWGVYDDRLTFDADGNYTYDPGDGGTVYVNNGSTLFPEYNVLKDNEGKAIDFTAPVALQNAAYSFDVLGDKVVLRLAPKSLFPYLSSDNQYNNPVFTVLKLTNSEMVLLYEDKTITWRFMLTSKEDATSFSGFKANSEFNLWNKATFTNDFYYAHGDSWEANPQPIGFETLANNKYKISLPCESNMQWQAQVKFFTTMTSSSANNYDFSAILTPTNDIKGATVKLVLHGGGDNDNVFYFADRVDLDAGDSYVFWKSDMPGIDMDRVDLVLDFGGAPAGTEVELKNVVFKNHADDDGTVLPSDQPEPSDEPSVNWVAVDSPLNIGAGFNTAGTMTFWWADASWNQVEDPQFSYDNGTYTITANSATASEWQAQCAITGVPLNIEEAQAYDVRVKVVANQPLGRVTVKVNKDPDEQNDPNTLCYKGDFSLEEGDNFLEFVGVVAKNGDNPIAFSQGKFILDFGGCPAGFQAKVSDIIIQKHKTEAVMSYDSPSNLWKTVDQGSAFISVTPWFADNSWSQIGDPVWSHEGNKWTLTIPEGMGGSQWQGQFPINTTLATAQNDAYNFSCTILADNPCPGVTIKLTETDDQIKHDDNFYFADRHAINADEPFVYKVTGVTLSKNDAHALSLFFDFGGTPVGTNIVISNIIFEKSN